MISSISGSGYQPLHSTASNFISSAANIAGGEQENEAQPQSAVPTGSRKVRPTVSSQESQAGKKETEPRQDRQAAANKTNAPTELSEDEVKEVQKLKQRDVEVRAHEAAHLAAAGQHAQGGAKFTLKKGPDGKSYAVGGSVSIDTSPEADPEATIRKADQIRRAALAPAEPSGQDRAVAAEASKMKLDAQVALAREQRAESQESADESENANDARSGGSGEKGGNTDRPEPNSGVERLQSKADIVCEVCGGEHPTAPHLEANQRKAGAYSSIGLT